LTPESVKLWLLEWLIVLGMSLDIEIELTVLIVDFLV
jgi:hypothetical protein